MKQRKQIYRQKYDEEAKQKQKHVTNIDKQVTKITKITWTTKAKRNNMDKLYVLTLWQRPLDYFSALHETCMCVFS